MNSDHAHNAPPFLLVAVAVAAVCGAGCTSAPSRRHAVTKPSAKQPPKAAPAPAADEAGAAESDGSVLKPVSADGGAPAEYVDVELKPFGLADEDLVIGGAAGTMAVMRLNTDLLRRVAFAPGDIRDVTLGLTCRRLVPSIDVLASGDATRGAGIDLVSKGALRSFRLAADEDLVLAVWKRSWHWYGGAESADLAVVHVDAGGTRRAVQVPGRFGPDGRAETDIGTFALVGLSNRDKLPRCESRVPAAVNGKVGPVPGASGVSVGVKGRGRVTFHTNGRQKWGRAFDWAPALAFSPRAAGTFGLTGKLVFSGAQKSKDHKIGWLVGRMGRAGGTLKGSALVAYRMLRDAPGMPPRPGMDYATEPVARVVLDESGVGKPVKVDVRVTRAVKAWLAGEAADHGLLLAAEPGAGAPPEIQVLKKTTGTASVGVRAKETLFDHEVKPREGVYAHVKDGRLYYGDRRLRLWGVVEGGSGGRNRRLGFNCLRMWHNGDLYDDASSKRGETVRYTKGDGSKADRYDRRMAGMKENDVFVMFASLTGFGMKVEKALEDGSWLQRKFGAARDWKEWRGAALAAKGGDRARISYFDDRLFEIRLRHARCVLDHVNPYTGTRYAEEEIIALVEVNNEIGHAKNLLEKGFAKWPPYFERAVKRQWNEWLAKKYESDAALSGAWGKIDGRRESLAKRSVELAPLLGQRNSYPRARQVDLVTFVYESIDRRNQQFRDFCRSLAPAGVGVNVVPFSFDTMYRPSIPWAYTNTRGDTNTVSMYFWGNGSMLASPPGLYVLDSHRIDGKLSVIYETGRGRPSRYRTEYPYMLSVMTDWQDFDVVVWHGAWIGDTTDEQLLAGGAAPPHKDHFWTAVHLEHDPVMSSAVALAGRLYLGGYIGTAPDPARYTVGKDAIFSFDAFHGIGGREMSHDTFTRGTRIALRPKEAGGVLRDRKPREKMAPPTGPVRTGEGVVWDWPKKRLIIDRPGAKVYVGPTVPDYRFGDGITISGFDTPFIAFALVSADGRPLVGDDACARAYVSAVFDAKNTGFEYDYACSGGPREQAKAVKNWGRAPVVVDRVSYTVSFPFEMNGRYTAYDFAMRRAGAADIAGNALRRPKQTEWMGVLDFARRGAAREPVRDASPGAIGGREGQSVFGKDATDARLAGVPNPIPDLSWGDSYHRAHRLIRDGTMRKERVSREDTSKADEKRIAIDGAVFLMERAANVEIAFARDRMKRIHVEFTQAPSYLELVAKLENEYGKPVSKKLTDNAFEQSEVCWRVKRPGGTLSVFASETQGVVRVEFSVE